MRLLFHLLVVGLFAAMVWTVSPHMTDRWQTQLHRWQSRRSTEQAVRSTAYPLDQSRWLEFDLPPNAIALRLLTNAALTDTSLPPIQLDRPRRGWKYSIDYQLFNSRLEPEPVRQYHLRTLMRHSQQAGGPQMQGNTWFQDVPLAPAQTRTVQIPLTSVESRPRRIRIRLASHDDQVQEVVTRVYFKHERSDYQEAYTWSRLSIDARQQLCRASVYPPDLLTASEKRNLLRWDWTALPPRGQQGVHYEHRLIYQKEDPDTVDLEFLPPPDGVNCRPNVPVTIPTPSEPGSVQLSFFPDHKRASVERAVADVWIHRKLLGTIAHHQLHLDEMSGSLEITTTGDLLEIVTNDHLICVANWQPTAALAANEAAAPVALSSSAQSIRAFLIGAERPLTYSITHVNELATPLRVTLRAFVPRTTNTPPNRSTNDGAVHVAAGHVAYEFLDEHDQVIRHGELETPPHLARYDQASIGSVPAQVSEPATYFFSLPVPVKKVRFHRKHGDVAALAFTRPIDLPRTFRIPEEQGVYRQHDEIGRTWFLFQPHDYLQRIADNQYVDVQIQTRPLTAHALLNTGEYQWDDHRPREFTPGRFVLTPRDSSFPPRDEAAASTYYPIPLDDPLEIRWQPDRPDAPLDPRLIYVTPEHHTGPIRVWIDDRLHHEFIPRARNGEVSLPIVHNRNERHTLRITASAGSQVYLRNIVLDGSPSYTKRFVYELDNEGLTFDVVKHGPGAEQFVLRTLIQQDVSEPSQQSGSQPSSLSTNQSVRRQLQVSLLGVASRADGPFSGWTIEQRLFDIATSHEPPAIVLAGPKQFADQNATCTIVLDEDLPPGTYPLRVRHLEPPDATVLVSLYRIRTPAASRRDSRLSRWSESIEDEATPGEVRTSP